MTTSDDAPIVSGHGRSDPEPSILDAPAEYPFPRDRDALMPWSRAAGQLEQARNYWLATMHPDGRPHVTPFWGAWLDNAFYFQGVATSRWARNIAHNPAAALHLESGDDVIIVDGTVNHVVTDAALAARLIDAWRDKYGRMEPAPATDGLYRLRPDAARGWGAGLQSAARWTFAS